jgi:hypothetical protein
MRIMSNIDVPCGCDHRKYIMFTQGKLGIVEGAILGAAAFAIIAALKFGR